MLCMLITILARKNNPKRREKKITTDKVYNSLGQTDSKLRTLQDIRLLIKDASYTTTPTSYFFERKGYLHVSAPSSDPKISSEEHHNTLLEYALELEVEDINTIPNETNVFEILVNDVSKTMAIAKELQDSLPGGWEVIKSGLAYVPNEETMVRVEEDSETANELQEFIDMIEGHSDVNEVFSNASVA